MMQRIVDSALGVAKESIKTFTQESFTNFVKVINGFSALVLAILPGKNSALEGWELHPTFRAPRLPRWMENGVSSFNNFIDDIGFESDSGDESEDESVYDESETAPSSPCSQASHLSRSSSSFGCLDRKPSLFRRTLRNFMSPIRWFFAGKSKASPGPARVQGGLRRSSSSSASLQLMYGLATRQFNSVKDLFVVHRTTDTRRRGVIEDLQLYAQLLIEKVFDIALTWIHYFLSPLDTLKAILKIIFGREEPNAAATVVVNKATLGDPDPSIKRARHYYSQTLNTDDRTCEDFITSMGYPFESLKVTTADGYVLSLERIPRRDSRNVLYLQHGLFDSSLGWVSSGVVGSQAFAAFDQGFDVFLGNFRGLASRDHMNKHISSQRYWRYSVNEHGTQDIPAMLNKVHEIKMKELQELQLVTEEELKSSSESGEVEKQPYTLCGVSHSLGGAAMLMYLVTRRLEGKPHYMTRAILLSPAGFHEKAPPFCKVFATTFPILGPVLLPLVPGLYIPTKVLRMLFNKLARDFQNYPALGGLVQTLCGFLVGGDSSNWVGAFGMTHYNTNDMPGVSLRVAMHLAQMQRSNSFSMFDFGSATANLQAYGTPYPLDVGAHYGMIDIPVDVVAGKKDKLIPRSMVLRHYQHLKAAGCQASYDEFEYAHLDFTFSHKEELLEYVMSRLLLASPNTKSQRSLRGTYMSRSAREAKKARSYQSSEQLSGPSKSGNFSNRESLTLVD